MMDRDTVVRLAKEAELNVGRDSYGTCIDLCAGGKSVESLTRFATLIANETLERAAKVCESLEQVGWPANQEYGSYGEFSDAATRIRALKDQS